MGVRYKLGNIACMFCWHQKKVFACNYMAIWPTVIISLRVPAVNHCFSNLSILIK